jgi:hypothetical protein
MANWAYVENNTVKERHDFLPKSWKNVSRLDKLIDDVNLLNNLGWFKVEKEYQDYDNSTQRIIGYNYEFTDNKVIESLQLEDYIEEKPTFEKLKETFLNDLREKRNELLRESDWSQSTDIQNLIDDETKNAWINYRQTLRNLPKVYESNEVLDLNQVEWPDGNIPLKYKIIDDENVDPRNPQI